MSYIKKVAADNIREQICALYNKKGDWRALANIYGVKKSTAYRWVNNQQISVKQRGGKRNAKITNKHLLSMKKYFEENPKITLKQLRDKIKHDHQLTVSTECLRKHKEGLFYNMKKDIGNEPEIANIEMPLHDNDVLDHKNIASFFMLITLN